jgi:hypothetical protein
VRERITIITKSTTKSSTGAYVDPSSVTIGEYWATLEKERSYLGQTNMQSNIEDNFVFIIRNPLTYKLSKSYYILWEDEEYAITAISRQSKYNRFIHIKVAKTN